MEIFWWVDKFISKEELCKNLGLDPETIDGDYNEYLQCNKNLFDNRENIDERFYK
jgi:hypothetical protein